MLHVILSEDGCVTYKLKLCHAILGNSVTHIEDITWPSGDTKILFEC